MANNQNTQIQEDETFSFKLLLNQYKRQLLFTLGYWKTLTVVGFITAIVAVVYAFFQPITYTARTTFVVEDAKSGGGSLFSALSGSLGIDIGGMSGSNSMLAGDNVLELLRSSSLIKKTLLTKFDTTGTNTLADIYAETYGWKAKWKSNSAINKDIHFNIVPLTRLEDSLLQVMVVQIQLKEISVGKPDKKLGFFELQFSSRNEILSKLFCVNLINEATTFYINTKTSRLRKNIESLQKRADSLGLLLNRKTLSAAEASVQTLDVNLAYASPSVNAEISSRDKFMQSTVYAEIVKNLELSKTALAQESPTVQLLDTPEFPLKKNKKSKLLSAIMGFLGGFFILGFIVFYQKDLSKNK
jgi:LPS O-antigen subunit length determinant protein (WzzB/FepE family)